MPNLKSVVPFLLNRRTLLVIYITAALIASVQLISLGTHVATFPKNNPHHNDIAFNQSYIKLFKGKRYTEYNNYVIFKRSYFHLINGQNLYSFYPDEQWDLYKYSPTFALLFGVFAYLPDIIGLSLWSLLNALALFAAIRMLPFKDKDRNLLLWFVLLELLTSMQSAQSNGLMAGLMIAAYACMQRGKTVWATLWLVVATYIKVYGAIGFCLFLLYPDKIKFILYSILWSVLLLVLPLVVMPYHALIIQYQNWIHMMGADAATSYGLSVMGWLQSWFGVNNGKNIVMLIGIILFLLPFLRWKLYKNELFRLEILASMLIWVIIFNHKAESPTFIIAVAGAGIWYFAQPGQLWRKLMLLIVFIGTCLTPTDLFSSSVKTNILVPYTVKAVPCIALWIIIAIELFFINKNVIINRK